MIERWLQFTCDGCEETTYSVGPNMTITEFRKDEGIRLVEGRELCKVCWRKHKEARTAAKVAKEPS